MLAIALSLTASVAWGTADFLGGHVGRRSGPGSTVAITVWTQAAGFVLLAGVVLGVALAGGDGLVLRASDLTLGALAGVGGGAGVALLYRGLTIGRMGLVAPITAAGAATLPVAFGLAVGQVPSAVTSVGVGIALVAVVLVSWSPGPVTPHGQATTTDAGRVRRLPPGLADAVGSGLGFAVVFVALDATGDGSGLVPLLPMKVAAVLVVAAVGVARRHDLRAPGGAARDLASIAVLDVVAVVTFLLATRVGLLPVVAVLGSLYPAGTVLLARVVLDERLNRVQIAGIGLALTGISLIGVG